MFNLRTSRRKQVFFVHIPKTAGTSFRTELEGINQKILKDYGANNSATSNIVQKWAYDRDDFSELRQEFAKSRYDAVCGHVALNKYLDFVPAHNIVTFLRDPVARVVSNYNHHKTHHGWTCSFEDYVGESRFQNTQSKLLNGMPLTMLGLVGLTEQYSESLELINQLLSRRLKPKQRNRGKSPSINLSSLEPEIKAMIENANRADARLYSKAEKLFEQRKEFTKNFHIDQWVYSDVTTKSNGDLTGCAFRSEGSNPTELTLKIDGKTSRNILAKSFYKGFVKAQLPRSRYVGFNLPSDQLNLDSQLVTLEVANTGQIIYSNREA